jgi:hypothetical protein
VVGCYGQVIPVLGWTLDALEQQWGDDDPEDHAIRIPRQEESTDPYIVDEGDNAWVFLN